jgi:predicted ester cyclase
MDPLQRNKDLVRRAWDAYDRGDEAAFRRCVSEDWVERDGAGGVSTLDDELELIRAQTAAFPDRRTEIVHIVAEGDLVATRAITRATHTGEYFGVKPTGRRLARQELSIFRIAGDRIVESWQETSPGFYKQLTGRDAPPTS